MSQSASPRSRSALIALVILVITVVVGLAVWALGGDDTESSSAATPPSRATSATPSTPFPSPSEATTASPSPSPTITAECEGPDTVFNEEGIEQDSLLPDCGVEKPVTVPQQKKSGLGLACGGEYPVILYKTTTSGAKTSICGVDSSGADFRLVTKPKGGAVVDLKGRYEPDLDAFVADDGATRYTVLAYDGTLQVTKNGKKTSQKASDWISLDNEPDTD
ncbi:hypothetical protein [Aeromicrobium wangtongii]|uniref:Serine/threonine protein kinase n=1 Tax=Aeromicrobium wangtongii TaxID=2969247 RepID=A0ABY5M6L4_9ACTN|nr:hypothetical protein [Aeromicrobium wangtongii]MCD9198863.1 hypothetical protein [Aeromicrobium wangtongii]UUP13097.1 hypothetical protein NQV15_14725 [Aeromicrobium wangtongii]